MRLEVVDGLARPPVTPGALAPLQLPDWRVDADPEHVEGRQEPRQVLCPGRLFNDVLNDHVAASLGEGRDGAVEPVEEAIPLSRRTGVSTFLLDRSKAGLSELIRSIVAEGFVQPLTEGFGEGGLPRARRAVQDDDAGCSHALGVGGRRGGHKTAAMPYEGVTRTGAQIMIFAPSLPQ